MKSRAKSDITQLVISNNMIQKELGTFFPESIILNTKFEIVAVGKKICTILGFNEKELKHQTIGRITITNHIEDLLKDILIHGFFEEYLLDFKTSKGVNITFRISGIHLGLISDINNLIILNLHDFEEIKQLHNQLEAKSLEIDDFVYQSAHSLRGPLATIKGLINIFNMSKDKAEQDFLISKMSEYAEILDNRLSKLVDFSEMNKVDKGFKQLITLKEICEKACSVIEDAVPQIRFKQKLTCPETIINKGELIIDALKNIITYLLQQSRAEKSEFMFSGSSNNAFSEFEIRTRGIKVTKTEKEKLESLNFSITEILKEPEFSNFYAVKKIISKLKGKICLNFTKSKDCCIYILIPNAVQNV
ncbi:MAG TPA: hypothetical protein VNW06_04920 [Cytophagaceae bacterium]|nr:hypothetical protein [Cytophagaceae bacterium]